MKRTPHTFLNGVDSKHVTQVHFPTDKNSFKDDGDGKISFPKGLTITDDSEQHNGTRYDIKSMDIDSYKGMITADHGWSIEDIVGKTFGIKKIANHRVVIDAIQFAIKENALALYAYNMIKAGFLTDFSIETTGPWPDDDGVYMNSELVGLSVVIAGNNKSAKINEVALNSVKEAKKLGLDTTLVEDNYVCYSEDKDEQKNNNNDQGETMKFVTIKNSRSFAVVLKYKNAAGDEVETTVAPGGTVDVSEDQKTAVDTQVTDAKEPETKPEPKEETKTETKESFADVVKNAMAPITDKLNKLEQTVFDNGYKEPEFKAANKIITLSNKVSNDLAAMDYEMRHQEQINAIMDTLKGSSAAQIRLNAINEFHLEGLQKAKKVSNALTIADFGNFVISPELLTDIEGYRSDFSSLMSRINFKDTLSLQMAWLVRDGDVDMEEVEFCDDGANGNLKPISEYEADFNISNLHELAAVTPVCNAATRFLAVDLLSDVAQGYRTDFDRKRAQIFIARLQQAVNTTGNTQVFATTSDVNSLKSFFTVAGAMQEDVMNGVYILSNKSYWRLLQAQMGAGIATDSGFSIFTKGENGPLLLGAPFIVVPNELLPTLDSAETKTFVVEGVNVTINQAIFYVDLSTFAGRTSGNLKYDMSTEAAYEVNSVVKSAFQRNELVMRGSFFRGGAVKNVNKVVGLGSRGVS